LATPISHLAVPLALTAALGPGLVPPGLAVLALAYSVLPDLDAVGMWFGVPYAHPFGHRGFTHSVFFSVVLAGVGTLFAGELGAQPWLVFPVLFVTLISHGALDAMTDGGLGIAFFSPFSHRRYFLPWRMIAVSPLSPMALLSWRGLRVLGTELRYVWVPCGVVAVAGFALREWAARV
jgi:inner membrane protein